MVFGRGAWMGWVVLPLAGLLAGFAPAGARTPSSFFGVVPQAPLESKDWSRIGRAGLTVRLPVRWYEVEPRQGEFEFGALDEAMREAAAHGVRVMPQVGGSPSWIASDPAQPPLARTDLAAWRRFLRQLVERYGPGGELWRKVPAHRMAVHRWQIWNEPNFPAFWTHPSARDYVRLLRASAGAIRSVDAHATIVAAAVAPIVGQPPPWEFLREMYRARGARAAFDVAALHPYTSSLSGLEYEIQMTRLVMAEAGDARTPLAITEIGVASGARIRTPFDRGRRGQARYLARSFSRLATKRREWRLAGVWWFAWQDAGGSDPICAFCEYAGLLDKSGDPKPSWAALKRVVSRFDAGGFR